MKYVFFVTSHITFYMALSVQKHLNILAEDCVYICDNGYENERLPKESLISYAWLRRRLCSVDLLRKRQLLTMPLIKHLINRKFYQKVPRNELFRLFVPHLGVTALQILSHYPNCKAIHFYEEGTANYLTSYPKDEFLVFNKKTLSKRLKYWYMEKILKYYYPLGFFHSIRYPYSLVGDKEYQGFLKTSYFRNLRRKYEANVPFETYSISDKMFKKPYFRNHVIDFYRDENHSFNIEEGSNLFVFQPILERKSISYDAFLDIWKSILLYIPEKKIKIKFHPKNKLIIQKKIIADTQAMGKVVEVIPHSVCLEQVFLRRKRLKIYGFNSSLLLYAGLFKAGTIISFDDFILARHPSYLGKLNKEDRDLLRGLLEKYVTFVSPTEKLPTG